jgi:hypothetical protein
LEIGVSVGKCLLAQLKFLGPSSVVYAFDVEDINPTFERLLTHVDTPASLSEETMAKGHRTMRRRGTRQLTDTIKHFTTRSDAGGHSDNMGSHLFYMVRSAAPCYSVVSFFVFNLFCCM